MYTTVREMLPGRKRAASAEAGAADSAVQRPPLRRVLATIGPNVYFLGLVSMLTDISSEMVSSILPLYLVLGLGFTPLQFGIVDGLYNGVSAIARLVAGVSADRWKRHKEVAGLGYGLSAVAKLGLIAVGNSFVGVASVIAVDRTGKGIRTAPRDALISLSGAEEDLGTAFGVHRAMDTFGALVGPILAFALLALLPGNFQVVFLISFIIATLGVAALVIFVQNHRTADQDATDVEAEAEAKPNPKKVNFADAFRLLRLPRFRTLTVVASALALMTISDSFIYLVVYERTNIPMGVFPLLFVLTAVIYMALAVPVGRIADNVGRGKVLVAGYGLLAVVYALLLVPEGASAVPLLVLPAAVLLLGAYYAATDGVLMAMASTELPENIRASGMALLTTGTAGARLLSSVLFGAVWAGISKEFAVALFLVGLAVAVVVAAFAIGRIRPAEPA